MIYCNLKGGLGNILFQIAASYHLALVKNTECSFPNFSPLLKYLKSYSGNKTETEEYRTFLNLNETTTSEKMMQYNFPFHYINFIPKEQTVLINGFFQSEKYFIDSRKNILEFFKPSKEIEQKINSKYSSILKDENIAIHLRRGDYLKFKDHHPVQTSEYYEQSIELIKKKKNIKNIIIFSDDIEWCKDNLKFENCIFIENEKDYVELFLMSKCSNNIISNSSFSWWSAWLNKNKDKIVVGPKKLFGNKINHKTDDIIPERWNLL